MLRLACELLAGRLGVSVSPLIFHFCAFGRWANSLEHLDMDEVIFSFIENTELHQGVSPHILILSHLIFGKPSAQAPKYSLILIGGLFCLWPSLGRDAGIFVGTSFTVHAQTSVRASSPARASLSPCAL